MTSITDMVRQHLGDDGVARLTQHLGVDSGTAQAAVAAALPALVGAASSRMSQPGAAELPAAAGGLAGAAGGLLGNLFGGNHKEAAQQVSRHSGLDIHQAEKALLFLAPIVMARLAQQRQAGGAAAPTPSAPATPAAPGAPTAAAEGPGGAERSGPAAGAGWETVGTRGCTGRGRGNLSQGTLRRRWVSELP